MSGETLTEMELIERARQRADAVFFRCSSPPPIAVPRSSAPPVMRPVAVRARG